MSNSQRINNFRVVRQVAQEDTEVGRFPEEDEARNFAIDESRRDPENRYHLQRNTFFDLHEPEGDRDFVLMETYLGGEPVVTIN